MGRLRFHLFLQEFDSPEIVNKRRCLYGAIMPCGRGCNLFAEAAEQCSYTFEHASSMGQRCCWISGAHIVNQRARMYVPGC